MSALSRQGMTTIGVTLLALVLGSVVSDLLPKPAEVAAAPVVRTATVGAPVTLRTGTFTVTGLESAPAVKDPYGNQSKAAGRYLVVRYDLLAAGKTRFGATSDAMLVTTDGRRFGGLSQESPTCGPAQPGVTRHCALIFDVDPAVIAGAQLVLPAQADYVFGPAILEQAEIDLGIDAGRAQALTASTGVLDPSPEENR